MKKLRSSLVAFTLIVIMGGSALLGVGAGSLANAASSQHISTAPMAGNSVRGVAFMPRGWCPVLGMAC
jgi:hypothetical protein